jgi:hypothetical protein
MDPKILSVYNEFFGTIPQEILLLSLSYCEYVPSSAITNIPPMLGDGTRRNANQGKQKFGFLRTFIIKSTD